MHSLITVSGPGKCFRNFESEFHAKIKYDFRIQVLLCLKGTNWDRQDILHKIYQLKGYRCHKVVRYCCKNWSHLHIKFTEEQQANNAVTYFKKYNSDFTAITVDDLLKDWYTYERRANLSPPWTLAIVDVVGTVPLSINLLSQYILNDVLRDFGTPYLLPYTAALNETHVQVLFSSMTEALAACMAFGPWWTMNRKADQCFYRIRINPCHKEALLIRNSGGVPEEAFSLDYFVDPAKEINLSSLVPDSKKQGSSETCRSRGSQAHIVSSRAQKQKFATGRYKPRRNENSQHKIRTPVLYIPVIKSYSPPFPSDTSQSSASVNFRNIQPFVTDHQEYSILGDVTSLKALHRADHVTNIDHGTFIHHQMLNPMAQPYNVPNHLGEMEAQHAQSFTMTNICTNISDIDLNLVSCAVGNNQIINSNLSSDQDIGRTIEGCGSNSVLAVSTVPDLQFHSSNHTYEYTKEFSNNNATSDSVQVNQSPLMISHVSTAAAHPKPSQHKNNF